MEAQYFTIKMFSLLFIILFYVLMMLVTSVRIKEDIEKYNRKSVFISTVAANYLALYKRGFVIMGSLLFPFYFMFKYGCWYGKKFYNILIENKDENRIASWLI